MNHFFNSLSPKTSMKALKLRRRGTDQSVTSTSTGDISSPTSAAGASPGGPENSSMAAEKTTSEVGAGTLTARTTEPDRTLLGFDKDYLEWRMATRNEVPGAPDSRYLSRLERWTDRVETWVDEHPGDTRPERVGSALNTIWQSADSSQWRAHVASHTSGFDSLAGYKFVMGLIDTLLPALRTKEGLERSAGLKGRELEERHAVQTERQSGIYKWARVMDDMFPPENMSPDSISTLEAFRLQRKA